MFFWALFLYSRKKECIMVAVGKVWREEEKPLFCAMLFRRVELLDSKEKENCCRAGVSVRRRKGG
ncbi:MAG TPA: hypothetical protein DF364_00595 [Ruminococcaceae bacterium]|nr:hypothetical protein [Oscillospiraceae bacterium]HCU32334.1 hypothetical protein [Oscillospiraceae bacterium]